MKDPADLPHVRSRGDVNELDGERVVVEGTYEQVDVRMRPPPDADPVYRGHAVIRLEDGQAVYLEPVWSDAAIRPDAEIEKFERERVRAVGNLHEKCPTPEKPIATIIAPCLHPVETVEPASGTDQGADSDE